MDIKSMKHQQDSSEVEGEKKDQIGTILNHNLTTTWTVH